MTTRAVVLAVLVAAACGDEAGPMDRSTIATIAKSRGDAQGGERTGIYAATFEVGDCDCPDDIGINLCLSEEFADAIGVTIHVTEGDGFMVLDVDQVPTLQLSGAIDDDGTATLGSVYVGLDLDASLVILGRLDAEFDEDGTLTGQTSLRAQGELGGTPISCGSELEIDGIRLN